MPGFNDDRDSARVDAVHGLIHIAKALSNTQADTEDIFIYNNLIYNFGRTGSAAGYGILLGSLNDARVAHFQNIHVLNNTIYDNSEGQPTVGIVVRGGTNITYDDIFIRNNIIKGIRAGDAIGVWFNKVNATDVSVENNPPTPSTESTVEISPGIGLPRIRISIPPLYSWCIILVWSLLISLELYLQSSTLKYSYKIYQLTMA